MIFIYTFMLDSNTFHSDRHELAKNAKRYPFIHFTVARSTTTQNIYAAPYRNQK